MSTSRSGCVTSPCDGKRRCSLWWEDHDYLNAVHVLLQFSHVICAETRSQETCPGSWTSPIFSCYCFPPSISMFPSSKHSQISSLPCPWDPLYIYTKLKLHAWPRKKRSIPGDPHLEELCNLFIKIYLLKNPCLCITWEVKVFSRTPALISLGLSLWTPQFYIYLIKIKQGHLHLVFNTELPSQLWPISWSQLPAEKLPWHMRFKWDLMRRVHHSRHLMETFQWSPGGIHLLRPPDYHKPSHSWQHKHINSWFMWVRRPSTRQQSLHKLKFRCWPGASISLRSRVSPPGSLVEFRSLWLYDWGPRGQPWSLPCGVSETWQLQARKRAAASNISFQSVLF